MVVIFRVSLREFCAKVHFHRTEEAQIQRHQSPPFSVLRKKQRALIDADMVCDVMRV